MDIVKRSGKKVEFDVERIVKAIDAAMRETHIGIIDNLSRDIAQTIEKTIKESNKELTVEEIQDEVERLLYSTRPDVAKKYMRYRDTQTQKRMNRKIYKLLDDDFMSPYKKAENPMTNIGMFTYYRTYSRWLEDEGRREYWWETCRRAIEYNCSLAKTSKEEAQQLFHNMFYLKQFVAGRTLWIGGTEVTDNYALANFNCSGVIIDEMCKFTELFYLLMVGAGVGFRILPKDVEKLPMIRTNLKLMNQPYIEVQKDAREDITSITFKYGTAKISVGDSKEGWVQALRYYLELLTKKEYNAVATVLVNYDNVRPRGERLKRFGGTASGYESLENMFIKINAVIKNLGLSTGSNPAKLRSIDCLDIVNIIEENVVTGGVRRSAGIALIDKEDKDCLSAKSNLYKQVGEKWIIDEEIAHRSMSNNTIMYFEKPTREALHEHVQEMRWSGEPGLLCMEELIRRRPDSNVMPNLPYLVNPCSEVILRDRGLCNLTSLNSKAFANNEKLDLDGIKKAIRLCTRSGIRMTCVELEMHEWDKVQKEDRLIGVSITGWQDMVGELNYTIEDEVKLLQILHQVVKDSVDEYCRELNISKPLMATVEKPDGSQSLLPTVSPGLHLAHSKYHIRRIRVNANDPLVKVCEELNYPIFPENGQTLESCKLKVVEFPVMSTSKKFKKDVSAIEQLETYKRFMTHYVEMNASITITVKDDEWADVEEWLWNNWDCVVGVSFLSLSDSFYQLMPYEEITEEEYNKRVSECKRFDPELLKKYETKNEEKELNVDASECVGNACPIR